MRHENGHFGDQKNQNSEIPVIISFACFLLFEQQKNTKKLLKPYFYSVFFAKPKKRRIFKI